MNFIKALLGINWKTTLAGVSVIVAAVGRIGLAWKAKDLSAVFADTQLLFETVTAVIIGLGLLKAKDSNVTGTGAVAKAVDSTGTLTNQDGKVVGHQPAP